MVHIEPYYKIVGILYFTITWLLGKNQSLVIASYVGGNMDSFSEVAGSVNYI